jgi:hypothetical protein
MNTDDQRDVAFIEKLEEHAPEFFKIVRRPVMRSRFKGIWQYYRDCIDEDTIYVRLDDDICFIDEGALARLVKHRIFNPGPFIIYGNIVNNAVCSYHHQQKGTIPLAWGAVRPDCMDERGWKDPTFARRVHELFLEDVKRKEVEKWKIDDVTLPQFDRFSVNVICWFGRDFRHIDELKYQDLTGVKVFDSARGVTASDLFEEPMLASILPARLNRPNQICGQAIFCHFAYYIQRFYLENATSLLERYQRLAGMRVSYAHIGIKRMRYVARRLRQSTRDRLKRFRAGWNVRL